MPLALDQGLGILVWSLLAGGLLSGKFRRDAEQPENSRHLSEEWNEPPVRNEDRLYDTIEVLVDVAKAHEVSAAQVALAWLLGGGGDLRRHRGPHRRAARRQPGRRGPDPVQ